jgi:hypothetical protein
MSGNRTDDPFYQSPGHSDKHLLETRTRSSPGDTDRIENLLTTHVLHYDMTVHIFSQLLFFFLGPCWSFAKSSSSPKKSDSESSVVSVSKFSQERIQVVDSSVRDLSFEQVGFCWCHSSDLVKFDT